MIAVLSRIPPSDAWSAALLCGAHRCSFVWRTQLFFSVAFLITVLCCVALTIVLFFSYSRFVWRPQLVNLFCDAVILSPLAKKGNLHDNWAVLAWTYAAHIPCASFSIFLIFLFDIFWVTLSTFIVISSPTSTSFSHRDNDFVSK